MYRRTTGSQRPGAAVKGEEISIAWFYEYGSIIALSPNFVPLEWM